MTIPTDPTQQQIEADMNNARKVYRALENAAERLKDAVDEILQDWQPGESSGPYCSGVYLSPNSENLSLEWIVFASRCSKQGPVYMDVCEKLAAARWDVEVICEW